MIDILLDTLMDSLKLLPFLFFTFLIMEYIEHKLSNKNKELISKSKKVGPLVGGIIGAFPQCGFSVAATNFYVTRVITLGTLISVYLSTSDEMLPVMISNKADIRLIGSIILFKVIVGIVCGFIIDFIYRKQTHNEIKEFCDHSNCHCEENILKSSIVHTLSTITFIFAITFVFNYLFENFNQSQIENIFLKHSFISPFLSSLIGLVPSCASSVLLVELYLNNAITIGSMIAGLLTGSGVGLLVLFKENNDMKHNIKILLIIYLIGAIIGSIINIVGF